MKKLMFAMAIAATVGFAQAEDMPIGTKTTFDDLTVSNKFDFSVVGYTDWSAPGSEGEVDDTMVTAYDKDAEDYDAANGDNFLALEGVQNLAKNINTAIGDNGLYIDTMVKFTASEDAPTPGEGDKLVVWLRENAVEGSDSTYTLMVTAGRIDTDNYILAEGGYSYETDANVAPDTWYNLKVKAIANADASGMAIDGGVAGFVVFIDGVAAKTTTYPAIGQFAGEVFDSKYIDTANEQYALFPSLIDNSTAGAAEVKQLAFSGSGAIDTVAAFQGDCDPDPVVETYAVTYTGAENVTVVTDPADTTALEAGATVKFTVTPAENYEYATTPTGWTAENGAITMTYTVDAEGENVVTIPAPTAKSVGPTEDWVDPTDADAIAAIAGKQAAEAYPSLAGTAVAAVDAKKLTIWAAGIGSVDFSDAATGINTTAFLLNIANSSSKADIEAAETVAKEAIKITAISFDENGDVVLSIPDPATYGNGKIVVEGSAQLPADWHGKVDTDKFFRTKLVLDEVAAPAVGE